MKLKAIPNSLLYIIKKFINCITCKICQMYIQGYFIESFLFQYIISHFTLISKEFGKNNEHKTLRQKTK